MTTLADTMDKSMALDRPHDDPVPAPGLGEVALWALGALTFAALALLTWVRPEAFSGVRDAYLLVGLGGAGLCVAVPRFIPRGRPVPFGVLAALGFLALGLDQVSKWLAVCFLKGAASIPCLPGVFDLSYVENTGAAFGLLRGQTTLFIIMAFVTVGIIGVYFRLTGEGERMVQVALVLILAGALGNLLDRIFLGYVVDFLYVHWGTFKWPVFNIADSVIDVGVGLIVLDVARDLLRGEGGGAAGQKAAPAVDD